MSPSNVFTTAIVSFTAALCLANAAVAQDVTFYDPNEDGEPDVLIADEAFPSWTDRGTGSPTVFYDEAVDEWVMIFEARLTEQYLDEIGEDYSACRNRVDGPRVVWGLGRATSPDGLTEWTVDPEPVLLPVPGTWRSCSTAHPWVVVSEGTFHLYYKAEQGFSPCEDGREPPPWGCGRMTGVGYASSTDGGQTWDDVDDGEPTLTVDSFGFPTVVAWQAPDAPLADERWIMLLTRDDGLYLASSDQPAAGWQLDGDNPVLRPGTWAFAQDAWFQPSLTCADATGTFPYSAWIGGDSTTGGSGFDRLNSLDGAEWLGDGRPIVAWEAEPLWRHWDVVRIGDDAYVYYTTRDDSGIIRVKLAKVGDSPDFDLGAAGWSDRACLYGERPEVPVDTDPTDDTDPTGGPGDTDPIVTDPEGGCYCSSGGAPSAAWPWLAVAGLLGLARRRRQR